MTKSDLLIEIVFVTGRKADARFSHKDYAPMISYHWLVTEEELARITLKELATAIEPAYSDRPFVDLTQTFDIIVSVTK